MRAAPVSSGLPRLLWPLLGLAILLLFNLFFSKHFFKLEVRDGHLYGTLIDILGQGAKTMLLAIGMTLVIATGGIDLSVGSVMAIAGAIAAMLVTTTELPFAIIVLVALSVATLCGLWNGVLVAVARIQPVVATLILMVAGRGIAQLLTGGQTITFENAAFTYLGNGHLLGLPFTTTLVTVMLTATLLLTRRTALGLFIEAVGDNETASRFAGVNARGIQLGTYVWCGLCAGIAGLIAASGIKAADSAKVGLTLELDAIFAVVVGGTALTGGRFTLLGSIIGAILIQTLTITMYNQGVSADVAPVPKAVVIFLVCLAQSAPLRAKLSRVFRWRLRSPLPPGEG